MKIAIIFGPHDKNYCNHMWSTYMWFRISVTFNIEKPIWSFQSQEALEKHKTDTGKSFKCHACCLMFTTLCHLRGHVNSGCLDREGIKIDLKATKNRRLRKNKPKLDGAKTEALHEGVSSSKKVPNGPEDGFFVGESLQKTTENSLSETEGGTIEEIQEFTCDQCSKVFKSKNGLKFHINNHKNRPFQCNLCPSSKQAMLRTQEELDHHIEHKHTKVRCEYPNCFYENIRTKLREHVNAKHRKIRKFKCDHCEYTGTTGAHLRRHMAVHTNEKRFKCQWCDYRSNQRPNTANHEKLYCKYRKNIIN